MIAKKSSAASLDFNDSKMPLEHASVLIAVAFDGTGRRLWLSCKGETLIKGVTLIGSFQKIQNWQKKEHCTKIKTVKMQAFKVGFIYKSQELSVDILICYFSKTQELKKTSQHLRKMQFMF